jgi:DNA-binding transcriptional LysR family regulator
MWQVSARPAFNPWEPSMNSPLLSFKAAFSDLLDVASSGDEGAPRITLKQLNYFVSAAQNQSVARAAEALNVSPPAVSGAVAYLETVLGHQLFVRRHARGLLLTEAGHHLLLDARDILARVKEIESIRHRDTLRAANRIQLGCLGDIAPYIIPPLVRSHMDAHPGVDIRWHTGEHEHLMERLEEGSLDVVLLLDFEISPTMQATVLRPTPAQCVLPAGHRMAGEKCISLKELSNEPFILLNIPKTRDYMLSIFGDLGLQPRIAHRAQSAELVRNLVAHNFGYSLLNFWSPRPPHGGEVYRPLEGKIRSSNLVAVRLYRRRPSRLIETFVKHAQDIVGESQIAGIASS